MLALGTFGAGFLMRPLGAVVLGTYVDYVGRRRGLIVTLSIMALGTMMIAFVPGYAAIGRVAPMVVVLGRLLQGFSAGVELGGVSVYLSEMAPAGRKGFYVSWQSASQQLAIVAAAALGYGIAVSATPATVTAWAWRLPFFIGCLIVPIIFLLRNSLVETEAFRARTHRPAVGAILRSLVRHWSIVASGTLLVVMTTVSFYLITVYTPTFARTVLKLSGRESLIVTLCVGVSNFFWLPVMGAWSDRIGRRPILITFALLMLLTSYASLAWLVAAPTLGKMLLVELWLSFLYASYNGAMVVALTEVMPVEVRTAGFSLAYSLATALFGGFTPAASMWLIHVTGDKAAPGIWMSGSAVCGLIGTWLVFRPRVSDQQATMSVSQDVIK
jgi:MHS family citrate/tricarballylate:H+ symporter-like MFS transporter